MEDSDCGMADSFLAPFQGAFEGVANYQGFHPWLLYSCPYRGSGAQYSS